MTQYGISILSAGKLAGLSSLDMVSKRHAPLQAALAAHDAGFGIQLLPLSTLGMKSQDFSEFLQELDKAGAKVMAFEDRWGGRDWRHPWTKDFKDKKYAAVAAYYLLFPWRYGGVQRRLQALHNIFPEAVRIDLTGGPMEIDLHKGDTEFWCRHLATDEAKKSGVVIDTFHLAEFSEEQQMQIITAMVKFQVPVRLLQIQFRDSVELNLYMTGNLRSVTGGIMGVLVDLEFIDSATPVVIEMTPELASLQSLHGVVAATNRIIGKV